MRGMRHAGFDPRQARSTEGAWPPPGYSWEAWLLLALWRHRVGVAGLWLLLTAAAALVIYRLPAVYQSEAVVVVEPRGISERLVPSSVAGDPQDRLETARVKVLAHGRLAALIRELGLYSEPRRAGATEQEVVEQLRNDLVIRPVAAPARGPALSVRVTYRGSDPLLTPRVANRVAQLLASESTEARRTGSAATAQFLTDKSRGAKTRLEAQEQALRDFRSRYDGGLPDQEQALRATEGRLRAELRSLQQSRLRMEAEVAALEQALRGGGSGEAVSAAAGLVGNLAAPPARRADSRSSQLRARLAALLAVYRQDHPDVQRLSSELAQAEELEARLSPATHGPARDGPPARSASAPSGGGGPRSASSSRREGLEAASLRLATSRKQLEALAARQVQVAAELGGIEERLREVPLRRHQWAALMRDHALVSADYHSLINRQRSADLAAALERSFPPERVEVLDEAPTPARAVRPRRVWLTLMSSLIALAVSCLAAFARDVDLRCLLGFPRTEQTASLAAADSRPARAEQRLSHPARQPTFPVPDRQ